MASTNQELASALRMFSRFFDLIVSDSSEPY